MWTWGKNRWALRLFRSNFQPPCWKRISASLLKVKGRWFERDCSTAAVGFMLCYKCCRQYSFSRLEYNLIICCVLNWGWKVVQQPSRGNQAASSSFVAQGWQMGESKKGKTCYKVAISHSPHCWLLWLHILVHTKLSVIAPVISSCIARYTWYKADNNVYNLICLAIELTAIWLQICGHSHILLTI